MRRFLTACLLGCAAGCGVSNADTAENKANQEAQAAQSDELVSLTKRVETLEKRPNLLSFVNSLRTAVVPAVRPAVRPANFPTTRLGQIDNP